MSERAKTGRERGKELTNTSAFGTDRHLARRRLYGRLFVGLCLAATLFGVVALGALIVDLVVTSWGWLDWTFLTHPPSWFPENYVNGRGAGIYPALVGSVFLIGLTAIFTVFVGVGAAIYLEEYAPDSRLTRFIEANISNLAGVPSIVYGLLGLALFVQAGGLGSVLLAGALTLTLLILPIVIVSAQEAIRAVPDSRRRAAYGVGATRWEVTRDIVLPAAVPGIMTGTILSLSRAIGETAPLIMVGAATTMFTPPGSLFDPFAAMPMQIFEWASQPQSEFQHIAAAGSVVLLSVLLVMNATAVYVRHRYES